MFDDLYQVEAKDNYDLLDAKTLAAKLRSAERHNNDLQRMLASTNKQVSILKKQLQDKSIKLQEVIRTAMMEVK